MRNPSVRPEASDASLSAPKASEARPRRLAPIHPVLFAIFPLLALFVHNIGQTPIEQLFRPIAVSVLGTAVVWAFFALLSRNVWKGAIIASAAVLTIFSYTHIRNLTPEALKGAVGPACVIGLACLLVVTLKSRRPLRDMNSILNLASVLLILPSIWALGASLWSEPSLEEHAEVAAGETSSSPTPAPTVRHTPIPPPASPDQPDVYYIILDAYGRADRLKTFYDFDNTPFIEALEKRGFTIPRHSGANYDQTTLCLSSALNMNYLQNAGFALDPETVRHKIDDNAVAAYLRNRGYHYVNIWSGLEETRITTADLALNSEPDISPFEGQALANTAIGPTSQFQHRRYDAHRKRLLGIFSNLDTVAQLPYSKFVFAHILAPHPPFVFGANGEALYPKETLNFADASWLLGMITREEYKSGYIAQLEYINKRTLEAVDAILRQSRRRPIIIIQGDHGSRMNLDWESLENTDLREPFSILNAYYVPDKVRAKLYDTITPVNSFRLLLSAAFDAKYARLPDRSFYSTATLQFNFTDVTGRVNQPRRGIPSVSAPPASVHAGIR